MPTQVEAAPWGDPFTPRGSFRRVKGCAGRDAQVEAETVPRAGHVAGARIASPRLVPVIAAALEDPAMKSPAVVARFQAIADDDRQDPALRAKAAKVLRAKLGA